MAFLSLQLRALRAAVVGWQRQPPHPEEADLQPLCSWREVWMCLEQAQGEQVRVPHVILKTFPLLGRKIPPRWVVETLGFPGTPGMGGSASGGPGTLPAPRRAEPLASPGERRDLPNLLPATCHAGFAGRGGFLMKQTVTARGHRQVLG